MNSSSIPTPETPFHMNNNDEYVQTSVVLDPTESIDCPVR